MLDFEEFFESTKSKEIYLDNIQFKRINKKGAGEKVSLVCKDDLKLREITEDRACFTLTRHIGFKPVSFFELSISFGFSLLFKQENKSIIKWEDIDLVNELLRDNGVFIGPVISRISLLIAQITSSTIGQMPLITPPTLCIKTSDDEE